MTQPSDAWLRMAMPGLSADWTQPPAPAPDPFAAGAAAQGYTPVAAPAPGAVPPPQPPPAPAPSPLAPPTGAPPGPPPAPSTVKLTPAAEQQMQAMAAAPANDTAQAQQAAPAVMRDAPGGSAELPPDVQFRQVGGGGVVPAHEGRTRGPLQEALLMQSFDPPEEAANRVAFRTAIEAQHASDVHEKIAADALSRQEAAQRVHAQRAAELAAMRAQYDDTIRHLGEVQINQNRLWANASTGEKIGAGIMMFIGGFFGGANGNKVEQALREQIDADVAAQKQTYEKGLDIGKMQQTAYGMAMQQFNNEDAALAAARAAALDYAQAKVDSVAANWKGVQEQNRADQIRGMLGAERMQTAAAGFRFVPAQAQAARYQVAIGSQMVPGTVSEAQAQAHALKYGADPAVAMRQTDFAGQVNERGERAKGEAKRQEKAETGAREIASKLQQAGVPQARAAAERALKALNVSPGGKGEAIARWGLGDTLSEALFSDDANAREQHYNDFMSAAMKATYGNVTASEQVRAAKSYGDTGTPAARKRSIVAVLNTLEDVEKNAKAGETPEAQGTFDINRQAAQGGPPKAPTSATGGWEKK